MQANTVLIEGTLSGINLKEEIVPVSSDNEYIFPGDLIFELPFEYHAVSIFEKIN